MKGRSGCFCQQAEQSPSPAWRRTWPQPAHCRGGCLVCRWREQWPYHPVLACRKPGRRQCGQTRFAACRSASRRQIPQWLAVGERTGRPQPAQVREQVVHRPVSACRTRDLPQAGQDARAASSFIRAVQRQQCCRSMKPTGAPQPTQSRCLLPMPLPHLAGPRPSPTPASARPSSTASPSAATSSRPAPTPTASPPPALGLNSRQPREQGDAALIHRCQGSRRQE